MIEPMLVLSTGNLTFETCNEWMRQAEHAVFEKGDYGWFIYVAEPGDVGARGSCSIAMLRLRPICQAMIGDRHAHQ